MCYASEEIIKVLDAIKPPYNVNQLTQLNGINTLESLDEINDQIKDILKERKLLIEALKRISYVNKVYVLILISF